MSADRADPDTQCSSRLRFGQVRTSSMKARPAKTYNERLFGGGLRSWYHVARFEWARNLILGLPDGLQVIELGCYDARTLDYFGERVAGYVGIDSNDVALDRARRRFAGRSNVEFFHSESPSDLECFADGQFDLAIVLETLEHLRPEHVPDYLDQLARVTRGTLLVSVPNEMGPVFLVKFVAKLLLYGDVQPYRPSELLAATLRRATLVDRDGHKGFDYRTIIEEIGARFDLCETAGLPLTGLPPGLSPTVAIHARSRG